MKRPANKTLAYAALLLSIGLIAFAACNGDDSETSPTATDLAAEASATVPPADATPFQGSREAVEKPEGDVPSTPLLVDVRAAEHEGFDRIVFEFNAANPGFRAEYVDEATGCGSGLPVEIAGAALLQVRITPVAAHDEAGAPTFAQQELAPDLPSILEAEQTCDFEGEVTWVVGLAEEADFTAITLREPFRIVVDVAHP